MVVTVILTSTITPRVSPGASPDYRGGRRKRNVEEFCPFSYYFTSLFTSTLIKGCAKHGGMPDIEERVLGVERKRRGEKVN